MADSSIHIRLSKKLKENAEKVLEANGMDMSSAIRLFFLHIVTRRTIPLRFLTLNGFPPEFEEELCTLIHDHKNIVGPFKKSSDLLKSLYGD